MGGTSNHPTAEELAAYEHGQLSDNRGDRIEEHLASCATCRGALDEIRAADTDATLLRRVFSQSLNGDELDRSAEGVVFSAEGPERMASVVMARVPASPPAPAREPATPRSSRELFRSDWPVPDYERVQLCGEGAYGSVWAVRDRVGVYRAVKIIDMEKMGKARMGCRESSALETYCRTVGRHPYLIDIFHVGVVGKYLYYTMELADNDVTKEPVVTEFPEVYRPLTLSIVTRRRRIRPDTAIEITRRLLRGLARLHSLDLVHRDIKPANIVFVRHTPKLADIGMITPGANSTAAIGTPRYMPPDRVMDRTADIYAMGKVLHEMIAGQNAGSFPELPDEYRYGSVKWDMERVNQVIVRACAPTAARRFPSASEMLDELEACADYPFRSLFDDLDSVDMAPAPTAASVQAQIAIAALRAVPWVVGFASLLVLLAWLD